MKDRLDAPWEAPARVRALSRGIPPSPPPLRVPHSTRANSRDGQIKTDNSRARPRFGPTSASGSPVSTNRRPDPTTPICLSPRHLLDSLYPLPFDRVNAFVIEEV